MATTITTTDYGQYVHGKPTYNGGTWQRTDEWTSAKDGSKDRDRLFCCGKADDTPIYRGQYGFKCSCCYLGFSHTTAYHYASEGSAE